MSTDGRRNEETADSSDGTDTDRSRRDFVKATTAAASAGALGALAGCTGDGGDGGNGSGGGGDTETGSGGGGGGGGGNGSGGGGDTETGSGGGDGGGGESVTIQFLSANAAENSAIKKHYTESMKDFESKNENVSVKLQSSSYGDIKTKLSSTVQSGNPPALAESGSGGLEFFFNDKLIDHGKFLEGTDGLPEDWTEANKASAKYRDSYWSGGSPRHTTSNLGIRPKVFSQVGVSDPSKDLDTWSKFYDAITKIDDQMDDVIAYEETGVYNDLESYWGQARTAYTEGTDPWIRGDPENPDVVVASDMEDAPKTDGMIKNTIKLASEFSSDESASRGDEEIPSLMLTGRVASFTYATPTARRWKAVKEDAKIGWHDGDGDFMLLPNPKLDPDYGKKVGINELEGLEGQHGGHVWSLEQQHTVFSGVSEAKQKAAWDLQTYLLTDPDFVLEAWGEHYQSIPGTTPMMDKLQKEYEGELPQNFKAAIAAVEEYGPQYASTGASWDVKATDQIRWRDINETISQAIAGQHEMSETPSIIRDRIEKNL
jgi:ABC-type glycerol-3-phosphate transport system substrate-binding protein